MGKYKLRQFAEFDSFPNTLTHLCRGPETPVFEKSGNWRGGIFHNSNNLVLELGCGKGEYTLAMAEKNPQNNYIGIDIKGNRLWRGAKTALEDNLNNVRFFRTKIEFIAFSFATNEVDEIWITFPDPQPGEKREKKRLTAPRQLEEYRKILRPGGLIHLKTDSKMLFDYSCEVAVKHGNILFHTGDLYADRKLPAEQVNFLTQVQTYYEKKFLAQNMPICYLQFQLNA